MTRDRVEQGDIQFHCKDCDYYGLCNYYSNRKETSLICKNFHYSIPRGEWIEDDNSWEEYVCSHCGEKMHKILLNNNLVLDWSDFCPNCGADMRKYET